MTCGNFGGRTMDQLFVHIFIGYVLPFLKGKWFMNSVIIADPSGWVDWIRPFWNSRDIWKENMTGQHRESLEMLRFLLQDCRSYMLSRPDWLILRDPFPSALCYCLLWQRWVMSLGDVTLWNPLMDVPSAEIMKTGCEPVLSKFLTIFIMCCKSMYVK